MILTSEYIVRLAKAYAIKAYRDNINNEESKKYWVSIFGELSNIEDMTIKMKEKGQCNVM